MKDSVKLADVLEDYRKNWPEFDRPETRVMLGVIRLNDLVMQSTNALLSDYGLSQTAFEALMTLRGQPEPWRMTPTALFKAILVTSGGMTKVLKQLENDGLIERKDNPDDQRSRFVQLTSKGKTTAEEVMERVSTHDLRILEDALSDQQIHQLSKVLLRTVSKLESQ